MADEKTQRVRLSLAEGYKFVASFETLPGASALLLDEPPPLGEGAGPNASAMLATAIGNCLAASLLFCLRKSRAGPDGMDAVATATLTRNEAGRFRITAIDVELSPRVAPADAARLARCQDLFEDFCIVTESVRNGIPVRVTVAGGDGQAARVPGTMPDA